MRRLPIVVLLAVLVPVAARSETIDLTQFNTGPTSAIRIGGLTITGDNGELVAIERGLGLGIAGTGPDGSIDWISSEGRDDGLLTLSVNGFLNSLTVLPYMTVDGPAPIEGVFFGFQMGFVPDGTGVFGPISPLMRAPFDRQTIAFSVAADEHLVGLNRLGLLMAVSMGDLLSPYMQSHNLTALPGFSLGFSIVAVDYTPADDAPEPTTLSLLGVGALIAFAAHRRHLIV